MQAVTHAVTHHNTTKFPDLIEAGKIEIDEILLIPMPLSSLLIALINC